MLFHTLQKMSCSKYFFETQKATQFPHIKYCQSLRLQSGRQDSNLRPSAPKALHTLLQALAFRAISGFLLSFSLFLKTIHEVFDHYLTTFSTINSV